MGTPKRFPQDFAEIAADLADGDYLQVIDVSDTTDSLDGSLKKTLLSRVSAYVASKLPIVAGTWTATATAVGNVDAVAAGTGIYVRIGSVVVAFIRLAIDPSAASAVTVGVSLPVASTFASVDDCYGLIGNQAGFTGTIAADVANARAQAISSNGATTSTNWMAAFIYRVL